MPGSVELTDKYGNSLTGTNSAGEMAVNTTTELTGFVFPSQAPKEIDVLLDVTAVNSVVLSNLNIYTGFSLSFQETGGAGTAAIEVLLDKSSDGSGIYTPAIQMVDENTGTAATTLVVGNSAIKQNLKCSAIKIQVATADATATGTAIQLNLTQGN